MAVARQHRGAPARTGSLVTCTRKDGSVYYRGRIRLEDGSREWIDVPERCRTESRAREYVAWAQENEGETGQLLREKRTRLSIVDQTETFEQWATRWLTYRRGRDVSSVDTDGGRLREHVFPIIGPKVMAKIGRVDIEAVRDALDQKIVAGVIKAKTAKNAWGLVTKAFDDAMSAKNSSLRVREDDPTDRVKPTEKGIKTSKVYLYPDELTELLECDDVNVEWRRLYAVATYTYMRSAELLALEWADVDLERGTLLVHVQRDRRTGERRETKTNRSRRIPIEPEILPLLKAMRAQAPRHERVFEAFRPTNKKLASGFRRDLLVAVVDRHELHHATETRKAMTFHDLRATGITWCAVRGDDPLKIKQRAGHTTFGTTEEYIREAENLAGSFGTVFPPIPDVLLRHPGQALGQVRRKRVNSSEQGGGGAGNRKRRISPDREESPRSELSAWVDGLLSSVAKSPIACVVGPGVGPTGKRFRAPRPTTIAGVST
jgi:integrase